MKKLFMAGTFCLFPYMHANAETIHIDGVYDESPNQSYSAAGGKIQVSMKSGSSPYILKVAPVANKEEYIFAYGETAQMKIDYGELDAHKNVEQKLKSVSITVFPSPRIARLSKETNVVIQRDRQNPANNFDKRYRVVVKNFTPGTKGELGVVDVAIEPL